MSIDLRPDIKIKRGDGDSVRELMIALQSQVPSSEKDGSWKIQTEMMGRSRRWTKYSFLGIPIFELEEGERVPKGEPPFLKDLRVFD